MDARLEPRLAKGPAEETEIPPLSGAVLLKLHNAGFGDVISRLLAQSSPSEIARVRGEFLRRAAEILQGSQTSKVRDIGARLQRFAARPLPAYIDSGMADGLLCAVLLIDGGRAPSASTVTRALQLLVSHDGGV